MLLASERVAFASDRSPDELAEAFQKAGSEWRESTLSQTARRAGIIGWKVRVDHLQVRVNPRISGRNSFLPRFVGRIAADDGTARLEGRFQLHPFSRGFLILWLGALALG